MIKNKVESKSNKNENVRSKKLGTKFHGLLNFKC